MADVKSETIREAYEAPVIEDVPLRSDEQMLANCKNSQAGAGFAAGNVSRSCILPGCVGFQAS